MRIDDSYAQVGYGRLELIKPEDTEEMIEIDGKKVSKQTIKEALKRYLEI